MKRGMLSKLIASCCIATMMFGSIPPKLVSGADFQSIISQEDLTLEKEARIKLELLKSTMKVAEEKGFDIERENCTVWMSEQFLRFADYDELHNADNKHLYDMAPMYKSMDTQKLADELPDFERSEVIKMIDYSLEQLQKVMSGKITRDPVRKVEWDKVTIKNNEFVNTDGEPIFLYDYFSKAQNAPHNDENLYNDYLGNIAHPLAMSLARLKDEDGNLDDKTYTDIVNYEDLYGKSNVGFQMLWHSGNIIPQWMKDKYGAESLTHGLPKYTQYDIDNPNIRDAWNMVFNGLIPEVKGKNANTLGYILSNEPHWYTDKNSYFAVKNGISNETLNKFRSYLRITHKEDIERLNKLWGTSYKSFDDITISIPIDVEGLRKTKEGMAQLYDWDKFNMSRVTDWFTFLHDGIKKNDPEANTHLKVMPKIFTDETGARDHGMDMESLSNLTEMIGNDITIRKENFNATEDEGWEDKYAYYWREAAMTSDLLSSFGPGKINVNSESHFISTTRFRDKDMEPDYVRSVYWLSTIMGMDANFTWYWGRFGDGSVEPRILADTGNIAGGYAGSVAQMPRVANEYTQTMMDLNAFSTDIVKFQNQEKPIRVFYSETANINDAQQINNVFDLYESLYFEGVPVGYATKGIIENPKDDWGVILVYNTENVTDGEFEALQSYLDNGGKVVIDDKSLTKNEYNESRNKKLTASNGELIKISEDVINNMGKEALRIVKDDLPVVKVEETNTNSIEQKGCIWRVVDGDDENNKLLTIVNVGKTDAKLTITKEDNKNAKIVDMFTGNEMESTITLPSEGILFVNVGTKEAWNKSIVTEGLENPISAVISGNKKLSLNWLPVEGAESYNVYAVEGDKYTLLKEGIKETGCDITGLINGREYTYAVTAVNEKGESNKEKSIKVTGIPEEPSRPGNPTGLKAVGGDSNVKLSWMAGENAEKYNIYLVDGDDYILVQKDIIKLATTITGLKNDREYAFVVTSVVDDVESDINESQIVRVITKGAPNISVSDAKLESVIDDVQSKYMSFDAYPSVDLKKSGVSAKWWINEYNLFKVTSDKSYTSVGNKQSLCFDGDPSKAVGNLFFATAPNAIADGEKVSLPEDKYYIEAMVYLEGDSMSNFDISVLESGKNAMNATLVCSDKVEKGKWVKVRSTVLKGLKGNEVNKLTEKIQIKFMYPSTGSKTKYYIDDVKIMRENNGQPENPKNISAKAGNKFVDLTWDKVDGAESYNVYNVIDNKKQLIKGNITENNFKIENLNNNIEYKYLVSAVNNIGESSYFAQTPVTAIPFEVTTKPGIVTGLEVEIDDQQIILSWDSIKEASSYNVYKKLDDKYELVKSDIKDTIFTVDGLENKKEYTLAISASNEFGEGEKIEVKATPKQLPRIPGNIKAEPNDKSVKLSWDIVEDAASYKVYILDDDKWRLVRGNIRENSYEVNNLVNGIEYKFLVVSFKDKSESRKDITKSVTCTPLTIPGNVENTNVSVSGNNITISWNPVLFADEYVIYKVDESSREVIGSTKDIKYTIQGLEYDKEYKYIVTAKNIKGESSIDDAYEIRCTLVKPVDNPKNIKISNLNEDITISWDVVDNSDGYNVYRIVDGKFILVKENCTENNYIIKGVDIGVEYEYVVTAYNAAGESDKNNAEKVTIVPMVQPVNPTGVKTEVIDKSVIITWDNVEYADGYNVYKVENGEYTLIKEGITELSFTIDGLKEETEYTFVVTSVNKLGESDKEKAIKVVVKIDDNKDDDQQQPIDPENPENPSEPDQPVVDPDKPDDGDNENDGDDSEDTDDDNKDNENDVDDENDKDNENNENDKDELEKPNDTTKPDDSEKPSETDKDKLPETGAPIGSGFTAILGALSVITGLKIKRNNKKK